MLKKTELAIAKIIAAHGIKGEVKLYWYSKQVNPEEFSDFYLNNSKLDISFRGIKKQNLIAKLADISDRTAAEELIGQEITVKTTQLKKITEKDNFYISDLLGLAIQNEAGKIIGRLENVADYGAGDNLTIKFNNGSTEEYPFDKIFFPEINLKKKFIVFVPPEVI